MKIRLRELAFEGVGPFAKRTVFDFDNRHGVVLAENNLGKTTTIDLVRWLLVGDEARHDFRSLKPDEILFNDRMHDVGRGLVEAIVEVESQGTYRICRTIVQGSFKSDLKVWVGTGADEAEHPSPTHFMHDHFPAERVGFNLLTGEHIKEFQEGLSGQRVKESVERLLHIPEITSAAKALQSVERELTLRATRAKKVDKDALHAKEKFEANEESIADMNAALRGLEEGVEKTKATLADKRVMLGEARAGATVSPDDIKRVEKSITEYDRAFLRAVDDTADILGPLWRQLAVYGAQDEVTQSLKELKLYDERLAEWQQNIGRAKEFESLADRDDCICLRTLDEATKHRLVDAASQLRTEAPGEPRAAAVDRWTLQRWGAQGPPTKALHQLKTQLTKLKEIDTELHKQQARLAEFESSMDQDVRDRIQSLNTDILALERELESLRRQKSEIEQQRDQARLANDRLQTKMRKAGIGSYDIELANRARAYADAFQDVLEQARPHYREALRHEVEVIFRQLYQHDSTLRVRFDEASYIPHVEYDGPNGSTKLVLGEGTKVRLGVALLLGLRRVATEHPFLFLDNPFAALDDEGTRRLVQVLADEDDQVILLTKNRFTPQEAALLSYMEPHCLEFVWQSDHGPRTAGYTTVEARQLDELVVELLA